MMRHWIWLTASRRTSENQTHWLSDWVLPILFTILTLACLLLFSLETLASSNLPFLKSGEAAKEASINQPETVVISAFSA